MSERDAGWSAWDQFIDATPDAGFMQTSWWSEFRTAFGFRHFSAIFRDGGDIAGGAIVQKFSVEPESCFYYIQDGPVLPSEDDAANQVFDALMSEIERHRARESTAVSHLRIEPRWTRVPGFLRGFRAAVVDVYFEPRHTLCVDLRPPLREILAQMHTKGRYNIRLAVRNGVTVVEDASTRGIADFIELYEDTAARQGFSAKPRRYFEALVAAIVANQRGSVFFAEYDGLRLAAAIAVWCGNRATYFFGGSSVRERHVMAPYLLHWEMMRNAATRGLAWYDFWGVSPAEESDAAWANISVFKRKFGGGEVKLAPTMDFVFDKAAYERYTRKVSGAVAPTVRELSLVR